MIFDVNGKIEIPIEPRFAAALVPLYFVPGLGQVALVGTTLVLGGVLIYEGTKAYNNITARLNEAQKAKLAAAKKANAAKSKSKPKPKPKTGNFNPEKTAKKVLRKGNNRSAKNTGYEQKDGSVWSKDQSGGKSHGGSVWKKYPNARDFMNDKNIGTYDGNGKFLRGHR